jgi:hypothetical protein
VLAAVRSVFSAMATRRPRLDDEAQHDDGEERDDDDDQVDRMSAMPPPRFPRAIRCPRSGPRERRDEGDADRDEPHEVEDARQSTVMNRVKVSRTGRRGSRDRCRRGRRRGVNPGVVDAGDAGRGCRVARDLLGTFGSGGSVGSFIGGSFRRGRGGPRLAPGRRAMRRRSADPSRLWLHYQYDVSRSRPRWSCSTARIAGEVLMGDYSGGERGRRSYALIVFAFFIFIFW